jgi:hypothetical protein
LATLPLVRQPRLAVMPLTVEQFQIIVEAKSFNDLPL